jgi:hypothetical protein
MCVSIFYLHLLKRIWDDSNVINLSLHELISDSHFQIFKNFGAALNALFCAFLTRLSTNL